MTPPSRRDTDQFVPRHQTGALHVEDLVARHPETDSYPTAAHYLGGHEAPDPAAATVSDTATTAATAATVDRPVAAAPSRPLASGLDSRADSRADGHRGGNNNAGGGDSMGADSSSNDDDDDGTNDDDDERDGPPDPRRWKALWVCLVGGFMVLLDVSIVNVALKSITEGSLGASGDEIQWVLSGYALTFGLLLVPAGRLGDVRGRRFMFVLGLGLFVVASVLCGLAQNGLELVIARLLQGLAGGLLTPQISGLIQQLFSGGERGRAFGLFGATIGISTAVGPLLGGALIDLFGEANGWRAVFFVNLPIGLAAIPLALRLLPGPGTDHRSKHDYDPIGVGLLGAGIVVLLLPFVQEQQWKGSGKWLLVPLALVLLGAFLAWEVRYRRRGREAVVDLGLFRRRSFSFGTSMIALYFAGFTPLFFVLTLLLQSGLGYSALLAGATSVPFAAGSGLAAALGGRVVFRFGRALVAVGLLMVTVGFVGVVVTVHEIAGTDLGWWLVPSLLIGGIGSGLVISPNQALTLSEVPSAQGGAAGGLLQTGQRIGSAIGIAAVGSVFYARLATSRGDYGSAVQHGIVVTVGFLVAALLLALADIVVDRRRTRSEAGTDADVPERETEHAAA